MAFRSLNRFGQFHPEKYLQPITQPGFGLGPASVSGPAKLAYAGT
jgi:hypothetical protein